MELTMQQVDDLAQLGAKLSEHAGRAGYPLTVTVEANATTGHVTITQDYKGWTGGPFECEGFKAARDVLRGMLLQWDVVGMHVANGAAAAGFRAADLEGQPPRELP